MDVQRNDSNKDKIQEIGAELERLGAENKEICFLLSTMNDKYIALRAHVEKIREETKTVNESCSSRGLINGQPIEPIKLKSRRILVRTEEDNSSLVVKDGYLWRKYGQKIIKDNSSPRAYFRCSMAPKCHAKKKVQRSEDDKSVLEATYEGEHNHPLPGELVGMTSSLPNVSSTGLMSEFSCSSSCDPSQPAVNLDLALSWSNHERLRSTRTFINETDNEDDNNNNIMEGYIKLLIGDPKCRDALEAAKGTLFSL